MNDEDCVRFLRWCLPCLGLRWPGYRRVRKTVCKRVARRCRELRLAGPADYRVRLEEAPAEWARLEAFCRIPISRFYRDRGLFERLVGDVLPALAARAAAEGRRRLRCWSAGCASGEEPYSLAIAWHLALQPGFPQINLEVVGSDAEAVMIARAQAARYPAGNLKDLPEAWRARVFDADGAGFRLRPEFRRDVRFRLEDLRSGQPQGPFDLILCRNLVFTYFAEDLQSRLLGCLSGRLRAGGALVIGVHEVLPAGAPGLRPTPGAAAIYRKA